MICASGHFGDNFWCQLFHGQTDNGAGWWPAQGDFRPHDSVGPLPPHRLGRAPGWFRLQGNLYQAHKKAADPQGEVAGFFALGGLAGRNFLSPVMRRTKFFRPRSLRAKTPNTTSPKRCGWWTPNISNTCCARPGAKSMIAGVRSKRSLRRCRRASFHPRWTLIASLLRRAESRRLSGVGEVYI